MSQNKPEYLSEVKYIFKNNLGYESGYDVAIFDENNRGKKSHASVPLMLFKVGNLKTIHH
jgi:hypothetical protein